MKSKLLQKISFCSKNRYYEYSFFKNLLLYFCSRKTPKKSLFIIADIGANIKKLKQGEKT